MRSLFPKDYFCQPFINFYFYCILHLFCEYLRRSAIIKKHINYYSQQFYLFILIFCISCLHFPFNPFFSLHIRIIILFKVPWAKSLLSICTYKKFSVLNILEGGCIFQFQNFLSRFYIVLHFVFVCFVSIPYFLI